MNFLLLFVFGTGVGILSGLLGIGGGVVLVPGLIYFFGFSQPEAQGTSLAV
ncbi:TSUP family transporter, partial [Loigolactobacillus coryniformis]|uniref:TSUP family transporter n=1 Tax=Loigolactobacillus coryniformis TaxID=1610 RepID=UPI00387EABEB